MRFICTFALPLISLVSHDMLYTLTENDGANALIARNFLLLVLIVQLTQYVSAFFDVPIIRQVAGFLCLTVLPGFVILQLIGLERLSRLETVLFSVGFSIAFTMFGGLVLNQFGVLLGIANPLSLAPLLVFLNGVVLIGAVLVYLKTDNREIDLSLRLNWSPIVIPVALVLIFSIVGAVVVSLFQNNAILLLMIGMIAVLLVVSVVFRKLFPAKLYPVLIFIVAVALIYHSSLLTRYVVSFGSDATSEFFVSKTVADAGRWGIVVPYWDDLTGRTNAMLSVTILPAIYSKVLNLDMVWVFKILFPLIFAFVPVGLYQFWQNYIGKKYSLLATFLFMSLVTFYTEMLGLNRQVVAELFLVLLLLVIFNEKMKSAPKIACFTFLSLGLVTSHYAIAEIFLFFMLLLFAFSVVFKRPRRRLTLSMLLLFLSIMFAWYIYTSGSTTFNSFVQYGDSIWSQLGDFFNPGSRGTTVLRGLGFEQTPSVWNTAGRAFAYATQLLIVIGFLGLLTKKVRPSFDKDYLTIGLVAMILLAALILVPGLAESMNMTRFYHVLLFILAPFCVVGAEFITTVILKRKAELSVLLLLLAVLVPYFLFQTDFVYEVARTQSWSLSLSEYRLSPVTKYVQLGYTDGFSVSGARWLSKNVPLRRIYSDYQSLAALMLTGSIYKGYVQVFSNSTVFGDNSTVYLDTLNVQYNLVQGRGGQMWNTSELSNLEYLNRVYSNGNAEICSNKAGDG